MKTALKISTSTTNPVVESMEQKAQKAALAYEEELTDNNNDSDFTGGELGDMLNQNEIQAQFREEAQNLRFP